MLATAAAPGTHAWPTRASNDRVHTHLSPSRQGTATKLLHSAPSHCQTLHLVWKNITSSHVVTTHSRPQHLLLFSLLLPSISILSDDPSSLSSSSPSSSHSSRSLAIASSHSPAIGSAQHHDQPLTLRRSLLILQATPSIFTFSRRIAHCTCSVPDLCTSNVFFCFTLPALFPSLLLHLASRP